MLSSRWSFVLASVAVTATAGDTLAQEAAPSAQPDGAVVISDVDARRWYGWQVIVVDVPLAIAFDIGAVAKSDPVLYAGYGGYVVGAPVVHVANRNTAAAILSASTHLLLPGAGFAFGRVAVAKIAPDTSTGTRIAIGMTAGAAAATTIDAVFTSWGDYGDVTVVQTGKVLVAPWLGEHGGGLMMVGMGW